MDEEDSDVDFRTLRAYALGCLPMPPHREISTPLHLWLLLPQNEMVIGEKKEAYLGGASAENNQSWLK